MGPNLDFIELTIRTIKANLYESQGRKATGLIHRTVSVDPMKGSRAAFPSGFFASIFGYNISLSGGPL
ncbi:hypothetical protein D3C73_1523480 [compost metagenome]